MLHPYLHIPPPFLTKHLTCKSITVPKPPCRCLTRLNLGDGFLKMDLPTMSTYAYIVFMYVFVQMCKENHCVDTTVESWCIIIMSLIKFTVLKSKKSFLIAWLTRVF